MRRITCRAALREPLEERFSMIAFTASGWKMAES